MAPNRYHVNGKRVPSVTTVLKQLGWSANGLIYWANAQGLEGVTLDEARTKATGVGTIVHAMIEAQVRKLPAPNLDGLDDVAAEQIAQALAGWERWRERHQFEPLAVETSLVDDELLYGGTFDMAWTEKHVSLVDWKAANGVYADHLCQLAAYGHLWNKHNPSQRVQEFHLVRLGKDNGSFHHHSWPAKALAPAWHAFVAARRLYDLEREIKAHL